MEILGSAIKKGMEKTAENSATGAGSLIADSVKKAIQQKRVKSGEVFDSYLDNAYKRYNQIRTLATGHTPRLIVGGNSLYEKIGVNYHGKEIDTSTVDLLLKISNNIIIRGTGGAGKSMLMRYMFLTAVNESDYIPVLVELRHISNQPIDNISIEDLVLSCLQEFGAKISLEQLESSLEQGKHLFLFDGFDEIKESHAIEVARRIQQFASKHPENPCIVTSRPLQNTLSPLETFTIVETMSLNRNQAVSLASKIWEMDEKTEEFCKQLEETLYVKHKDFAENPLLLTMMFLTFMRYNAIPDHLSDFYGKCYEALYSLHDTNNKGYYIRSFKSNSIDETGFKTVFARFCFRTYFYEKYEFTEEEIIGHLKDSLIHFNYNFQYVSDYLLDLCVAVCMIVKEGDIYRFSHRSFQTYFAAWYTREKLTDEKQTHLYNILLSKYGEVWIKNEDYYQLLIQIDPERFATNALKSGIQAIVSEAESSGDAAYYLLRKWYYAIIPSRRYRYYHYYDETYILRYIPKDSYLNNLFSLFILYEKHEHKYFVSGTVEHANNAYEAGKYLKKIIRKIYGTKYYFDDIDKSKSLKDNERKTLYDIFKRDTNVLELYRGMRQWLAELDANQESQQSPNFIDEF